MQKFSPILILILTLAPSLLRADSARAGYYKFTQPDGSTVLLRNVGDDHFHYTTTKDNYVVTQQNRSIHYADIHPDGSVRSSGILARNSNQRDMVASKFLSSRTKGYPSYLASIKHTQSRSQSRHQEVPLLGNKSRSAAKTGAVTNIKSLVILVNFSDVKFTVTNPQTYFTGLFNTPDFNQAIVSSSSVAPFNNNGSVRDYFLQNTNNKYDCSFDVVGPVNLSNPMAYYGANKADSNKGDIRPQEMVMEACRLAKTNGTNFAQYANPNEPGTINQISIIYAGKAESSGGPPDSIWPHSWIVNGLNLDGYAVTSYACSSELSPYSFDNILSDFRASPIGTICHEFGHTLGLSDLYDTDYEENGKAVGLQWLSLMASGNHKSSGILPSGLSAIDLDILNAIDILQPTEFNTPLQVKTIDAGQAWVITTQNQNEYFYIEARSSINSKWDRHLDDSNGADKHFGMVVYHVDISSNVVGSSTAKEAWMKNSANGYSDHECAMPLFTNKNKKNNYQPAYGDIFFFPGPNGVTKIDNSTPGPFKLWSGAYINITAQNSAHVYINKIAHNGDGTLSFEIDYTPYTNSGINMARTFIKNTDIQLDYIATTSVQSISWFVDGRALSDKNYKTSQGTHTIKAKATLNNGNRELVIRKITVK